MYVTLYFNVNSKDFFLFLHIFLHDSIESTAGTHNLSLCRKNYVYIKSPRYDNTYVGVHLIESEAVEAASYSFRSAEQGYNILGC